MDSRWLVKRGNSSVARVFIGNKYFKLPRHDNKYVHRKKCFIFYGRVCGRGEFEIYPTFDERVYRSARGELSVGGGF